MALVAASSQMGIALHEGTSFPVGKADFMTLYPLNFREYLDAGGDVRFANALWGDDTEFFNAFREIYMDRLKEYLYVGGMPEAVKCFAESRDFAKVRGIQKNIIMYYEHYFSKHAPAGEIARVNMAWHSVPVQLAKENRKFIYGLIKAGARAREFGFAIQWLEDCGLVRRVYRAARLISCCKEAAG